ncbi:MAG: hypothetical protein HOP17_03840 [Acidobacteria bacterium]|nr:hypothetical protein [Acidobacteriota bacterium]
MMTREEKLLLNINKEGIGIEVGPSHAPIAPKRSGYNVRVIDHASREDLKEKFKDENVNLENIEEVDFVWTGESYAELTGKTHYYDWIIASHVIEHTPNLIGFINSCDAILNDTGVLSLAVPDVRFCFDHFRPISGLSSVMDAHFENRTINTTGSIAEFKLNHVMKDGYPGWGENVFVKEEYTFPFSKERVLEILEQSRNSKEYIDCHAWCFTPHSFRLLIHDLYELGFIRMKEIAFFPSVGCEFFIALGRNGQGSGLSRLEMLQAVNLEILNGNDPNILFRNGVARILEKMYYKFRNLGGRKKRQVQNAASRLLAFGK